MVTDIIIQGFLFISGALAVCTRNAQLFITAPKEMEALSGSCLQIPCNYSGPQQQDYNMPLFGVWIKNDPRFKLFPQNVIFNSSGTPPNTFPMTLTGNLSQKSCSTLFSRVIKTYTDTYYFRVDGSFKGTASCSPLQVTVHDSIPPKIHVLGELKEAESVTITCSAPAPCPRSPPTLTWNLQANAQRKLEQNPDGTFTVKIQQTFTLSEQHDGDEIICSATYPVDDGGTKRSERKETLSVSYAPKDTSASVSPSAVVSAGSSVTLSCSSRAKPPVTRFTWFRRSRGEDSAQSVGDAYTFNVTEGGAYYCVAANALGSQSSEEIQLTLTGSTQWEAVVGGIGGSMVLICVAIFALWRFRSARPTSQQTQVLQNEMVEKPAGKDVHYAEIDFSRQRRRASSGADSGRQQSVEYAEVNVCKTEKAPAPAEALYSEVWRK